MKDLVWEDIDEWNSRTKVFGGWIVKTCTDAHVSLHEDMRPQSGYEWRIATCFVPDPNYEWELEKEIQDNEIENPCCLVEDNLEFDPEYVDHFCKVCGKSTGGAVRKVSAELCDHPPESRRWDDATKSQWCTKCNTDSGIPF